MNANRKELIDIYNSLLPSLKTQLLITAKTIQATQDIVLNEKKSRKSKTNIEK